MDIDKVQAEIHRNLVPIHLSRRQQGQVMGVVRAVLADWRGEGVDASLVREFRDYVSANAANLSHHDQNAIWTRIADALDPEPSTAASVEATDLGAVMDYSFTTDAGREDAWRTVHVLTSVMRLRPLTNSEQDELHAAHVAIRNLTPAWGEDERDAIDWKSRAEEAEQILQSAGPWVEVVGDALKALRGQEVEPSDSFTAWDRLDQIKRIIRAVDERALSADGAVPSTRQEMTQEEMSRIYELAGGVPDDG